MMVKLVIGESLVNVISGFVSLVGRSQAKQMNYGMQCMTSWEGLRMGRFEWACQSGK